MLFIESDHRSLFVFMMFYWSFKCEDGAVWNVCEDHMTTSSTCGGDILSNKNKRDAVLRRDIQRGLFWLQDYRQQHGDFTEFYLLLK